MKTNYVADVQEMSMQEMREVNGGCCLLNLLVKLIKCILPKLCCGGNKGGGSDPSQPED
jgi:hypothetical protein